MCFFKTGVLSNTFLGEHPKSYFEVVCHVKAA